MMNKMKLIFVIHSLFHFHFLKKIVKISTSAGNFGLLIGHSRLLKCKCSLLQTISSSHCYTTQPANLRPASNALHEKFLLKKAIYVGKKIFSNNKSRGAG